MTAATFLNLYGPNIVLVT